MTTDEARKLADEARKLADKNEGITWLIQYPSIVQACRVLRAQADEIDRLADSETSWRIIVSDRDDEIDQLRAELDARAEVSSDVNSDHAREREMRDDEIDRLRATIAALLAVPDIYPATDLIVVSWLRRRMAAVVGGGE